MAVIINTLLDNNTTAPGDHPVIMLPRNYRKDASKPLVLYFPGTGSGWQTAYVRGITYDIMEMISNAGFPVLTSDLGIDKFGNSRSRAGIDAALTWAASGKVGLSAGTLAKVHGSGFSQGGVNMLSWFGNNPSRALTFTGFAPLTDLAVIANSADATTRGFTDRAYPSAYSEARDGAANNPQTMATAGKYGSIPMTLAYSSNDPVIPNSSTTQFKNTVGASATLLNLGALGHDNNVPLSQLARNAFLARIGA